MDLTTAKEIVPQYFRRASDPTLTDLLEKYSVNGYYRPYLVAGLMIYSDYRLLIKADVASWEYDKMNSVKGLLAIQDGQDQLSGEEIPEGLRIEDILALLFPSDSGVGMMII